MAITLGFNNPSYAFPEQPRLVQELVQAGLQVVGAGEKYGVSYVEIVFPKGMAIFSICRLLPDLQKKFLQARERIAAFNGLNPFYVKDDLNEPFMTKIATLKIPLDLAQQPRIFPEYDESLASHDKFILIDISKAHVALYQDGALIRVYPISTGKGGDDANDTTPQISFTVQKKLKSHWSNIYESWMPWALLIQRPFYIHGGCLPGYDDSAGCIRLLPKHAKELFHLVDLGTPGKIVCSRQ